MTDDREPMTVFAFSVRDAVLVVHPDAALAAHACVPDEVASDAWLFFAADGSALRPDFLTPRGKYYLRPWASCASCSLPQVLHMIERVEGPEGLDNVPAIAAFIMSANLR